MFTKNSRMESFSDNSRHEKRQGSHLPCRGKRAQKKHRIATMLFLDQWSIRLCCEHQQIFTDYLNGNIITGINLLIPPINQTATYEMPFLRLKAKPLFPAWFKMFVFVRQAENEKVYFFLLFSTAVFFGIEQTSYQHFQIPYIQLYLLHLNLQICGSSYHKSMIAVERRNCKGVKSFYVAVRAL